jgi:hypothetical protein
MELEYHRDDVDSRLNSLIMKKHQLSVFLANVDGKPIPEDPVLYTPGSKKDPSPASSTPARALSRQSSVVPRPQPQRTESNLGGIKI